MKLLAEPFREKTEGLSFWMGALTKSKADLPTELGNFSPNPKLIPRLNLNYRTDKLHFSLMPEAMYLKKLPNNEFNLFVTIGYI